MEEYPEVELVWVPELPGNSQVVEFSNVVDAIDLAGKNPAGQLAFRYKHGWILINPAIPSRGRGGGALARHHGVKSGAITKGHFEKRNGKTVFVPEESKPGSVAQQIKDAKASLKARAGLNKPGVEVPKKVKEDKPKINPPKDRAVADLQEKKAKQELADKLKAVEEKKKSGPSELEKARNAHKDMAEKMRAKYKESHDVSDEDLSAYEKTYSTYQEALKTAPNEDLNAKELRVRHSKLAENFMDAKEKGQNDKAKIFHGLMKDARTVLDRKEEEETKAKRDAVLRRREGKYQQPKARTIEKFDKERQSNGWLASHYDDKNTAVQDMKGFYGPNMWVTKDADTQYSDYNAHPTVYSYQAETIEQHHLRLLSMVHPAFHEKVRTMIDNYSKSNPESGIFIGHGAVSDLDDLGKYANEKNTRDNVLEEDKKDTRTLSQVGGVNVFDPHTGHYALAMGTVPGGSINMPAHEHGHAADQAILPGGRRVSDTPEFQDLWKAFMADPHLGYSASPYYSNKEYGHVEFFAETFATYNTGRARNASDSEIDHMIVDTITHGSIPSSTAKELAQSPAVQPIRLFFDELVKKASS